MSILEKNPQIVEPYYYGPRTIVLIPSIELGPFVRRFFHGIRFYEERYLYYLTFLKNPETNLVVVLSCGAEPSIIDYFLDHTAKAVGLPRRMLEQRFTIIWVPAHKTRTLAEQLLRYHKIIQRIRSSINDPKYAYIEFWRVTKETAQVARKLGLPYYGLEPKSFFVNTKSGARKIFKRSAIALPRGVENLPSLRAAHQALRILSRRSQENSFLIKMNDEGSGVGIIKVSREQCNLLFSAFLKSVSLPEEQPLALFQKFYTLEKGVIEEFIDRPFSISPSVQFEITPRGEIRNLASHDQILQGTDYLGAFFPASAAYRKKIIEVGTRVAQEIQKVGGRGFIAMDLLVTKEGKKCDWKVWGIEINARKGGTNHTHMWAKYLTQANYNPQRGILESSKGDIYYQSSEQFMSAKWLKRVPSHYLLSTIKKAGLDFDHNKKVGVFVHLLSPLPHFGKFGVTVIGHSKGEVQRYWDRLTSVIQRLEKVR